MYVLFVPKYIEESAYSHTSETIASIKYMMQANKEKCIFHIERDSDPTYFPKA